MTRPSDHGSLDIYRTHVAKARRAAKKAGYYVRRGGYSGTTDDRLDRWYTGHTEDPFFRPFGGYATASEAWLSFVDDGRITLAA